MCRLAGTCATATIPKRSSFDDRPKSSVPLSEQVAYWCGCPQRSLPGSRGVGCRLRWRKFRRHGASTSTTPSHISPQFGWHDSFLAYFFPAFLLAYFFPKAKIARSPEPAARPPDCYTTHCHTARWPMAHPGPSPRRVMPYCGASYLGLPLPALDVAPLL